MSTRIIHSATMLAFTLLVAMSKSILTTFKKFTTSTTLTTLIALLPLTAGAADLGKSTKFHISCGYATAKGTHWVSVKPAENADEYSWTIAKKLPSPAVITQSARQATRQAPQIRHEIVLEVQRGENDQNYLTASSPDGGFILVINISNEASTTNNDGNIMAKGVLLLPGQTEVHNTACRLGSVSTRWM